MKSVNRCPLCGSMEFVPIAVEDEIEIARCVHCNHGFSRQVMPPDEVKRW